MAQQPSHQAGARRAIGRLRSSGPVWVSIIVVTLVIVSLPSMIILFFGMTPTIVAFIIDRSKQKSATFCVGGMNLCGVFVSLLDLWTNSHTIANAMNILTDVFALMWMFLGAAIGWMLYVSVPPVVISFLTVMSQHKVAQMRSNQKEIIEEWGESVTNSPEMRELRGEEILEVDGQPLTDEGG
ncbi:MAG: acyl-CoA synthetase [Rhodospirillales bacterium]